MFLIYLHFVNGNVEAISIKLSKTTFSFIFENKPTVLVAMSLSFSKRENNIKTVNTIGYLRLLMSQLNTDMNKLGDKLRDNLDSRDLASKKLRAVYFFSSLSMT